MKAVSALTSRYNVILITTKGGDKMKDKEIRITIKNGTLIASSSTDVDYSNKENTYSNTKTVGLKDIAVVIESLKKEQEKIMNRQKDETNRLPVLGSLKLGEISELNLIPKHVNKSPPEKGINIIYNPNIHIDKLRVLSSDGRLGSIKIDWD